MSHFGMTAKVRFNRPIQKEDILSPGGYEMVMKGKTYTFDFMDYIGIIDTNDPTSLIMELSNLDLDYSPDSSNIGVDELKNVTSISEFFIFTGEDDETDLCPIELVFCNFFLIENANEIDVPKDVCQKANVTCAL